MTDEELKQKAEKNVTKLMLLMGTVINDAIAGMTEDEQAKFMFYFIAAYGAIGFQVQEEEEENKTDTGMNLHEYLDLAINASEMVYNEKPDGDV